MMTSSSHNGRDLDLKQRYELLRNEFQAVRRKLDSKNDALLILTKDLAESNREKDQYKLMADQLRNRCQSLKRELTSKQDGDYTTNINFSTGVTSQLEIDELRQRLADSEADVKLLREKIIKHRLGTGEQTSLNRKSFDASERDELIKELERSKEQFNQLEQDMKQLLDEKEELVTERDTYKVKYSRLNEELNFIMRGEDKPIVDVDAIILENKFLQQKVKHLEEENATATSAINKYKRILEKRKPAGILKTTTDHMLGGLLLSQQHVKQLLSTPDSTLATSPQVIQELKNLSATLLETINDKNLALTHQRKSNKLLASRISDLEQKIHELELQGANGNLKAKMDELLELRSNCQLLSTYTSTRSNSTSSSNNDRDLTDSNSTPEPAELTGSIDICSTPPECDTVNDSGTPASDIVNELLNKSNTGRDLCEEAILEDIPLDTENK